MFPVLDFGTWSLRTYSLTLVLAILILVAGSALRRRAYRDAPTWVPAQYIEAAFFLVLAGLGSALTLGALPHVIEYLQGFRSDLSISGLRWPGAAIGVALAWVALARARHYSVGMGLDMIAPMMPLALAIVRVGCLSAGCCWGQETDGCAALFLPDVYGFWAWRYPTQLISLVANLLIFAALLLWERFSARSPRLAAWRFDGSTFALYLLLYGSIDFGLSFWRADLPLLWHSLRWNQAYELLGVLLALFLFAQQHRKRRRHAL